jgi:hypothetical protein
VASPYERPTRSHSSPIPSISSRLAEDPYRSPLEQDSSDKVNPQTHPGFEFEEADLGELDQSLIRYPDDPREPLHTVPLPLPFEELVAPSSSLHLPPPIDPTVREAALRIGRMSIRTADDKGKAGKPSDYDGSAPRFHAWWREVSIYLRVKKIADDEERILTTLSYMKTGLAASWADRFWDNSAKATLGTWANFSKDIKETFSTKDVAKEARQRLEEFRQGTCTIDEFFTLFETMASDAEITGTEFDAERIRLLEQLVKREIIDIIYNAETLPDTYASYKSKVLNIGRLRQRRTKVEQRTYRGWPSHPSTTHSPSSTAASKPSPPRPTPAVNTGAHGTLRTGSGTTFTGHGRPMDIGTLKQKGPCFKCGVIGHFARDCPKEDIPTFNIRQVDLQLTPDEKLALLALWQSEAEREVEGASMDSEVEPQTIEKDFL